VRSWPRALLAGVAFSGAIQLAQLAVSLAVRYWYRMLDVDDVLLNVAGVQLGWRSETYFPFPLSACPAP
jgi:glycopeptide antibiotics resistance protein